jgi:hypothetical protein
LGTNLLQYLTTSAETREEEIDLTSVRGNYFFNEMKRRRKHFFKDIDKKVTEEDQLINEKHAVRQQIRSLVELMVQHPKVSGERRISKVRDVNSSPPVRDVSLYPFSLCALTPATPYTIKLQEDVHHYMQHVIPQLDSFQTSQLLGDQPTTAVSFPTGQATTASDYPVVNSLVPTHLTLSNPISVMRLPSQAQTLPPCQLISPLVNHDSNTRGDYFHFAKLQNPVQKMLESLNVTDALNASDLIKFLRTLVRLRLMTPAFRMSTAHILQMVYPVTKGTLASKTLASIHSGDTLDVYHELILPFFITSRTMLPLLNAHYYRRQSKDEPLATYVADIKFSSRYRSVCCGPEHSRWIASRSEEQFSRL